MTKTIQYPRSPLFRSEQPGGAYFLSQIETNTVPLACAGCAAHENYTSAAVNESGIIRPAVETYA